MLALLALLLAGCVGGAALPSAATPSTQSVVHVLSNGWHTGIVVARADIPAGLLPEIADFPTAPYLEFGWGDRAYYPDPQPTAGMALVALLKPTPAVMHIAGRGEPPLPAGRRHTVLTVPLANAQLRRLVSAIDASFDRPADGRATAVAAGLYPDSLFYPARGQFHLFHTCNTWTAHRFTAAGLDMPERAVRAHTVMSALQALPGVGIPAPCTDSTGHCR